MPFVAGNKIDAFCPNCKRDQQHTVIEVSNGVVRTVRCEDCRAVDAYHRPHTLKKAESSARSTKRKKAASKQPEPAMWEMLVAKADP